MSESADRPAPVLESIVVAVPPRRAYDAVAQVHRMARWSPECFGVWVLRRRDGVPVRFVGFNRRRGYVWFTTCTVVVADPGREFAFDVFTFGQPVSRWGYRFAPASATGAAGTPGTSGTPEATEVTGATEVTEYWEDRRNAVALRLGRIFTGKVTMRRPAANRAGMRTTLARLKLELETP